MIHARILQSLQVHYALRILYNTTKKQKASSSQGKGKEDKFFWSKSQKNALEYRWQKLVRVPEIQYHTPYFGDHSVENTKINSHSL